MRRRRALALVSAAAVAVAVPLAATQSQASNPPTGMVTVPVPPGTGTPDTYMGDIPPGANPTSDCTTVPATDKDVHTVTVNVPAGAYNTVTASFKFSITFTPNGATEDTSDEIITVVGPANKSGSGPVVGSGDTSNTTETVTAIDLQPGVYQVQACGFVNATLQHYTGKVEVSSTARTGPGGETGLPSAPPKGLAFSASVPADPQKDESEPLIETAPDGRTYTCGPTGFSSAADYAQVSTDGGDQFHLIGTPPRGQQAIGGGGDCAINLSPDKDPVTKAYTYGYAGLGPLTGFTASTSPDNGHTLFNSGPASNGITSTGAGADRQWVVFTDAKTALLSYNQQAPRNIVVQKSLDGGLTYGTLAAVAGAAPDFPGPMRTLPEQFNTKGSGRVVYFAWNKGSNVNLSVSYDQGASFVDCVAAVEPMQPSAGFVTADNDNAGNIYISYADKGNFHTHLVTLLQKNLKNCNQNIGTATNAIVPKNDPQALGFSTPLQVDRDKVRTSLFAWVAAGGAPGHVAVAFYGTETEGNPNLGTFKASWNVYVNQSTNALSTGRTFSQVKATTHPIHYDSICLNGLGCSLTVPNGDRSLGDFFAIKTNPMSHRLQVVYDNDAKIPGEVSGHVGTPTVVTQIGGPSQAGGPAISGGNRPVVRQSSTDHTLDALANYSGLVTPGTTINEPASDFVSTAGPAVAISKPASGGGFTVTMRLSSLSTANLARALTETDSNSLLYVLRFSNGFQPSAVVARFSPASPMGGTGTWSFKYNDYDTLMGECNAVPSTSDDKCLSFGASGRTIVGSVSGNTITMTVPAKPLRALAGGQADQERPHLVLAATNSRFYDASAFSFGDAALDDTVPGTPQSYLYPLDNTPAMDFLLP